MTCEEAKNFYSQDTKEYELNSNIDFLDWMKISIVFEGYCCFFSNIGELQKLIDDIALWYEMKYPEREFFKSIDDVGCDFKNMRNLSEAMDMKQLLYRLSHNQLYLMQCAYRAKGFGRSLVLKNGKVIDEKHTIFIDITKKSSSNVFLLSADNVTGEVLKNTDVEKYVGGMEFVSLDELLDILRDYPEEVDITELERCIQFHNTDMELRHRILQLVALKLLYSRNTIPEIGYKRAKRFIDEFNQYFGLTLSTSEIDEIMNKDYKNEKNSFEKKRKFL